MKRLLLVALLSYLLNLMYEMRREVVAEDENYEYLTSPSEYSENTSIPRRLWKMYEESAEARCVHINSTEIKVETKNKNDDQLHFQMEVPKLKGDHFYEIVFQVNKVNLENPKNTKYVSCLIHEDESQDCIDWYYTEPFEDMIFNVTTLVRDKKSPKFNFTLRMTSSDLKETLIMNKMDADLFLFIKKQFGGECLNRGYRKRRRVQKVSNPNDVCHVAPFEIDFSTIGWEWIVQPEKYNANKCQGSCKFPAPILNNGTNYAVIKSIYGIFDSLAPATNCAPVKTREITLIVLDHNSAVLRTFKNMVVEECCCV